MPIWYLRPVVVLSILLGLSAIANVFFLYFSGRTAGKYAAESKIDELQSSLFAATTANAVSKALAERNEQDRLLNLESLNRIAERAQETRYIYRTAAAAAPLAENNCAPGKGRQDAVNKTLGPVDGRL